MWNLLKASGQTLFFWGGGEEAVEINGTKRERSEPDRRRPRERAISQKDYFKLKN